MIIQIARGYKGLADSFSFVKKQEVINSLNKVVNSPKNYFQDTLKSTLISLTKLDDDRHDTKGLFGNFKLIFSEAPLLRMIWKFTLPKKAQ